MLSRIKLFIKNTRFKTQNLEEKISGDEFNDVNGQLARTMNEMISRIKKSIDYMNQFSISAAHEMKTPLTVLRGEIELALRSKIEPDEFREILQSNHEETIRLINIVDKLFFISKFDHLIIKKEKTELNKFLLSVIKSVKKIAENKNIELNFMCEEKIYGVIDPALMNLTIFNLIENAVKYGNPNQIVCIKLGKRSTGEIFISITNKGEYITPIRDSGGAGLGLSVVKLIVEMHGGEVNVESNSDGLNIFTIVI